MAMTWGSWEYSGGNGMRLGVDITVTTSGGTATVKRIWKVEDQSSYSDSQTLNLSGDEPDGATNFTNSMGQSGGVMTIKTNTTNYSQVVGSSSTKSYSGNISGAYNGVTPSVTGKATIPAKAYDAPDAPTNVAAERVSDTKHTITWKRNATTNGPYTSQKVQRYDYSTSTWTTIASGVSGSATSYSDTTTTKNKKYTWRVQAVNSTDTSTSSNAAALYTTPDPPTSVKAVKDASNNVKVSWTAKGGFSEFQTEVWDSPGGGALVLLGTVSGTTLTYTHTTPSATSHQYSVRHKTTSGAQPTLYSSYAQSPLVQVAAPPLAPTDLHPAGEPMDATDDIIMTWQHNPVDASPQVKIQVQHRTGAGAWTMTPILVGNVPMWTLPANTYLNGLAVEWQVRTWGTFTTGGSDGTGASPWSASATFNTSTPPTVTISSPADGAILPTGTAVVTWVYYDAESTPQTGWTAQLLQESQDTPGTYEVIEEVAGADTATTATFSTTLSDDSAYRIQVTVRDGAGMASAPDYADITVDYAPPADVLCEAVYDEEWGVVTINLFPRPPVGAQLPAEEVNIWRRIDGSDWLLIARAVLASETGGTTVDTQPGVHNLNEYRLEVFAGAPTYSSKVMEPPCSVQTEEKNRGFLTTGAGFEFILSLECGLGVGTTNHLDKALHHFAGRPYPLEFSGTARTAVVSVTGTTTGGNSPVEAWEAMAFTPGIVLWRDPSGRRVYGSLGDIATGLMDMGFPDVWTVSFPVTEVDYVG